MPLKSTDGGDASEIAQSLRIQAIECLNGDFGPATHVDISSPETEFKLAPAEATRKISGWWIPSGIIASVAVSYFGLKPNAYSSYITYAFGMACALGSILLLKCFFRKLPKDNIRYDLSSGPVNLVKAIEWLLALMAFLLGWIIGDFVLLKIGMY